MPPGDDERVDIDVVMHDLTSPAAENIDRKLRDIGNESGRSSDAMDDLADSTDNEDRQLAKLNKRLDKTHRGLTRTERIHRRWDKLFQRNGKHVDDSSRGMERYTKSVDKASKAHERLNRNVDRSHNKMVKFFSFSPNIGKALGLIKISALLEALPMLATALSAVGAAAVAAVAGLTPLVGLAGAGATGITALAQTIGTFKMSVSGIGDALKVLNKEGATAEEIAEAMKDLPLHARRFVIQLKDLKSAWGDVRKEVQNTFFAGLDRKLEKISMGYLPIMERNLKGNARALNAVVKGFADMVLETRNMRTVNKVMERNNRIVEAGGKGLVAVAEAFLWVSRAAGPMTERMTNDFTNWLMGKSNSAQRNQKELREFFNDSYDLLKKTIRVLDDFGEGLMNVGRASMPLARYLGGGLAKIMEDFNKWTSQPQNFKRMLNFFKEMREPLGEFTRLVGVLGGGILTLAENDDGNLARVFARFSDEIVPNLVTALGNLQKGGTIDAILDLANSFVKLIDSGFIGASGPIVRALALIAGAFADFFSSLPKDMRTAVVALMMGTSMIGKLNFGAIMPGKGGGQKLGRAGLLGALLAPSLGGRVGAGGRRIGGGLGMAGIPAGVTPVYVVNMGVGVPGTTGPGGLAAGGRGAAVGAGGAGLGAGMLMGGAHKGKWGFRSFFGGSTGGAHRGAPMPRGGFRGMGMGGLLAMITGGMLVSGGGPKSTIGGGAIMGAGAGSMFGLPGAAIGAGVGAVGGGIKAYRDSKKYVSPYQIFKERLETDADYAQRANAAYARWETAAKKNSKFKGAYERLFLKEFGVSVYQLRPDKVGQGAWDAYAAGAFAPPSILPGGQVYDPAKAAQDRSANAIFRSRQTKAEAKPKRARALAGTLAGNVNKFDEGGPAAVKNKNPFKNLIKDIKWMDHEFRRVAKMTIPQYKTALAQLPKTVQTKVTTPGMVKSREDISDLAKRYKLTPKKVETLFKLYGIEPGIRDLERAKARMDALRDKRVKVEIITRAINLTGAGKGGAGKAGAVPGVWTGGPTQAGKWYLTGEAGPEAHVDKMGRIRMLGLHGPEYAKPGAGAVVNADATRDPWGGDPHKSPEWAVAALRKAAGASARQAAARAAEGVSGGTYSLQVGPIYPQSEMDVEGAVRRAWQKLEKERRERS